MGSQPYSKGFAPAYNRMWTDFADRAAPRILDFYQGTPLGSRMAPVLDICCGAGTLALYFLEAGYEVTGIDLSLPMLEIAEENAREYVESGRAEFILADAVSFKADPKYGLAVSTFDSMNHLDGPEALRACIGRTYGALTEGGVFIFDLNTRRALEAWGEITVDDDIEAMVVKRGGFDPRSGRAFYKVSGFMRASDGRYDRFEETIVEVAYDLAEVKEMLLGAGFISAYCARGIELERPADSPDEEDRVFFVARK